MERSSSSNDEPLKIIFSSEDDETSGLYHKHLRDILGRAEVQKGDIVKQCEDTLVLPLPSAFGLYSNKQGFVSTLLSYGDLPLDLKSL